MAATQQMSDLGRIENSCLNVFTVYVLSLNVLFQGSDLLPTCLLCFLVFIVSIAPC